ncbi:MAG: tetratricopeptide repeat protein [bacterium]
MSSTAIRMGLAVRQNDVLIAGRLIEYPGVLPLTHPAAIAGWQPALRWDGGVLVLHDRDEFRTLSALEKQLEVNRCHAEARLALARSGALDLDADEEEFTVQRAVGILPGLEDQRFLELASCHDLSPERMTSSPHRFLDGIVLVEREFGQATALGYGFLLLAGVRARDDLVKYGRRIEEAFGRVIGRPGVAALLESAGGPRLMNQGQRNRLMRQALQALADLPRRRSGPVFLLTQVVDGFLGLRPGGVGTSFGLAVLDALLMAKLDFRVGLLVREGRYYLSVAAPGQDAELWDPLEPAARVPVVTVRRLSTADVLVDGYVHLARGYVSNRAYSHVERVARWLLGMKPDLPDAHELLAISCVGQGRPQEAVEHCRRALASDQRQPETWLVQGNAWSLMSRWQEAIDSYRRAIGLRVGYAEAYNNLGLALDRNGEHERAVGAFEEALRTRPDYAEALYNLGNSLLEHEHLDEAIDAYRRAVEASPRFAGAHYNMGQAYYRKGEKRKALEAYRAAVDSNPKHAGAWHNLGIVYRDLGEPQRAVEAIERAVAINPTLFR